MNFRALTSKIDKQDQGVLIGISFYFIVIVLVVINTVDACDSVDSTFFVFEISFQHPGNFLNHWAKPLFVLLSAPFLQEGFI